MPTNRKNHNNANTTIQTLGGVSNVSNNRQNIVGVIWENIDLKSGNGILSFIIFVSIGFGGIALVHGIQGKRCDGGVNISNIPDWGKMIGCFIGGTANRIPENINENDTFNWSQPAVVEDEGSNLITAPTESE